MTDHPLPPAPELMFVDPATAASWLERNKRNRAASPTKIAQYARSMKAGEWQTIHQGIAFAAEDGALIDGQNRLHAIIQAGVEVPLWVYPAQPSMTFKVVDTGLARQAGQFIDHPERYAIAGATRMLATILGWTPASTKGGTAGGVWDNGIPTGSILDLVERWRDELFCVASLASPVYRETRISLSGHIVVLFMALQTPHVEHFDGWIHGLKTGSDLSSGDARLVLRTRYLRDFRALNQQSRRRESLGLITKAWNSYVSHSPVGLLRLRVDEPLPFPLDFEIPEGARR